MLTKTKTKKSTAAVAKDPIGRDVSRDIFSASIGSICCCYTGQPFDTVRVRMQTNPSLYPTIHTSFASILRKEGPKALWKGSIPTFSGMILENIFAFGINEAIKRSFPPPGITTHNNQKQQPPGLIRPLSIGIFTGSCLAFVLLPSEVIKTKLQMVVGENATLKHILRKMLNSNLHYKSFACGLDAQLIRDSTFYACFFGGYDIFKYGFATYFPNMPEKLNYFLSGGLAGCLGWALAMPADVPKTIVQASYKSKVVGSYAPEIINIACTQGIRGFYKGLCPTLVRAFPANASLFLGVEMGKKAFDKYIWTSPSDAAKKTPPAPRSSSPYSSPSSSLTLAT